MVTFIKVYLKMVKDVITLIKPQEKFLKEDPDIYHDIK
jgi:hypothetical protein